MASPQLSSKGNTILAALLAKAAMKSRLLVQGRLKCFELAVSLVEGKSGIEIGGPTDGFQPWQAIPRYYYGLSTPLPIYDRVGSLDNCNFSDQTIWSSHHERFHFSRGRPPGRNIIAEGSNLSPVPDAAYDFVLSSHNLEHFANPVKALLEWKRITRRNGALVLVLPDYRRTFDHNRTPTPVDHMMDDYEKNIGEEDTTHLPEVLQHHDVRMDGTLQTHTPEELRARSLANVSSRCMHHHVFDENNSRELLARVGLEVLAVELALPYHIFILSRWKE